MRRLVKDYTQNSLQIIQGTVTGVQSSKDGKRVEFVHYRTTADPDSTSASIQSLPTTFFVDCSGPSSISSKILPAAGAGWGPYPRLHYNPNVIYRSGTIQVSDPAVRDALSRTLPIDHPDYGRWDRVSIFEAFAPAPQIIDEFYAIQKVDGDQRTCMQFDANVYRFLCHVCVSILNSSRLCESSHARALRMGCRSII